MEKSKPKAKGKKKRTHLESVQPWNKKSTRDGKLKNIPFERNKKGSNAWRETWTWVTRSY